MYEAKPVFSFEWLTHADLAIIVIGCLTLMAISFYFDVRDRKRERQIQDALHRSVLDCKSRIIKR